MASIITGGTGFVGKQVLRMFLEKGEKNPIAFDVNPSLNNVEDIQTKVEIVKGDLGNFSQVLNVVKKVKPDVIFLRVGNVTGVQSVANRTTRYQTHTHTHTCFLLNGPAHIIGLPSFVSKLSVRKLSVV